MSWWKYDNSKPLYPSERKDTRADDAFAVGFLLSGPAVVIVSVLAFVVWLIAK